MARNIFRLSFVLHPKDKTIKETSTCLLSLLEILRKEDDIFSKFTLAAEEIKSVKFDLSELEFNDAVEKLAQAILKTDLSNIRKYEKAENPTIDFARDLGFQILLIFHKNGKEHFSITGNISSSQFSSLAITHFPVKNSDYEFDWYFRMLKIITEYFNPIFSGVNIRSSDYIAECRNLKIKYPLGWITYFSDESKIEIPSDIGFEAEKTEKGVYLILTREDITQSKEAYWLAEEKLLEAMQKIKKNSANYSEP